MRPVRAVLIAVPQTAWAPDDTVHHAVPTAAELGGWLERRFTESTIERVAPEGGPVTKAAIRAAFARARPARGELFVVLFFGHGIPADEDHPYQSWALSAEELTDLELAAELHGLPGSVDTVLISNCCFGRGFYHAGPRGDPTGAPGAARPYEQLGRAFSARVLEVTSAPMVCISAAGPSAEQGAVLSAVAGQLVSEVIAAAERGLSYRELDAKFRRERFAGRDFFIDARPEERMSHLVLDSQVASSRRRMA